MKEAARFVVVHNPPIAALYTLYPLEICHIDLLDLNRAALIELTRSCLSEDHAHVLNNWTAGYHGGTFAMLHKPCLRIEGQIDNWP